jgi:hypothetical protein
MKEYPTDRESLNVIVKKNSFLLADQGGKIGTGWRQGYA